MIPVTKTFFPPKNDYEKQITKIWDNKWLTNNGKLYLELTDKLKKYLKVSHVLPMTNGTLPIQIALKVYGNQGEIITTPFSYVATTSSIVWENCVPVFVDIHPEYLTIDETKIEAAITVKTTAILATHVYGNPCNVEVIQKIANKYNLKVIYDGAHCFGVNYKGNSIFNYGDVSTCSFHATKLFHTGEGGSLFCNDNESLHKLTYSHNFAHNGTEKYYGLGINAKMSELQAAMGLCVLPYMEHIIKERKRVCDYYNQNLKFDYYKKIKIREGTDWNYSYYPIIIKSEEILLEILEDLALNDVFPRRYFFPSLETLPYINSKKSCYIADDIAKRVLCLPLYTCINSKDLSLICKLINKK